MFKKLLAPATALVLTSTLLFGLTGCSLFVNPDISEINMELNEEKQLQSVFKKSGIEIAKNGGIYSVVDKKYVMNIAYDSTYTPYDIIFYSDGKVINAGSTSDDSFVADPLSVLGATLFEFGDYTFTRKDNVYTAKEKKGGGVMTITIKNNLVNMVHSVDGDVIYDIEISYKLTKESTYLFDAVNKDALTQGQKVQTDTNTPAPVE